VTYSIDAGVDLEREVVRVQGKGAKVRDVPIKGGTLEAIREWLACRGEERLVIPYVRSGRGAA